MKPRRRTVKPERKPYRFTLLVEGEKELIEYLDSFSKPLRGRVIVEALKLQMRAFAQKKTRIMKLPKENPPWSLREYSISKRKEKGQWM